jgi:secreted Zn-dependent insulinase-like peptidase
LIKEWAGDSELWYFKDDKFERPKAILNLKVYPHRGLFEGLGQSSQARTVAEVWAATIKEYLREFIYMAQMASLELEVNVLHDAVSFTFSGFNDSLFALVTQGLELINEFSILPLGGVAPIFA